MRILLIGVSGRMGGEVLTLCQEMPDIDVVAGVGKGAGKLSVATYENLNLVTETVDIVIDFSLPEIFSGVCSWSLKHKIPLVSGTTGLSADNFAEMRKAGEKIAVLWSPNMSLGVAWMRQTLGMFAKLNSFDFQIDEIHHRHKKDKPSGTAIYLKESLDRAVGRETPPINSSRVGGVFGVHRVLAVSEEEQITLEHSALNRRVFARGALTAAQWLRTQAPGCYSLKDVLGF